MSGAPYRLVAGLVSTSAVVTTALVWSGWRLAEQQSGLDAALLTKQAETAADAMAAGLRERLLGIGEQLGLRLASPESSVPPPEGLIVVFAGRSGSQIAPADALPFVPVVQTPLPASRVFTAGEAAEFRSGRLATAADHYRELSVSADEAVRANALFRLGRVLRKAGSDMASIAVFEQLAALGDAPMDTTGVPARLAGLDGQRLAYRQIHDDVNERRMADQIRGGLDEGQWVLTRGTAEHYRSAVSDTPQPESWLIAAALADAWPLDGTTAPPRGQLITGAGRPVLVVWRAAADHVAMGAMFVDRLVDSVGLGSGTWQLRDVDDRVLAGTHGVVEGVSIDRLISGGGAAWTLRLWPDVASASVAGGRQRTLVAAMAAMLLFVWGATYLMARVIGREAEIARLQSDFVAAVSHEFRSPLTTMRQMVEMLDAGRVPAESRRREYYRVLVRETARLQRLVETILNFGRMEAGTEGYRFVALDTAGLVESAVSDVRAQPGVADRHIEIDGPTHPIGLHGDADALRLALRNLIDNAIKYSPDDSPVRVRWGVTADRVTIEVIDQGTGVSPEEQTSIFRKFVRGLAAEEGRVAGTGVGLAIVQGIAIAHNGEIRIRSDPRHGSTFSLVLPTVRGGLSEADSADASANDQPMPGAPDTARQV